MKRNQYTAVILASIVLAANANVPSVVVPKIDGSDVKNTWPGLGLNADVNEYVDNTIHGVVPLMQAYGLDPMPLPDVEEGFEVRPLLVTYSAWLRITQGRMSGLGNVRRSGDQMVNYFAKMLRVRVQLQFSDLRFDYRYLVKVMNIGPTGGIVATLDDFTIVFDILIDFNNDEAHLQEFRMTDIGRLRVRFTGNILTDWLVNPVIGVFTRIFDTIIIRVVEANIRNSIHLALGFVNNNVKGILDVLESFGN